MKTLRRIMLSPIGIALAVMHWIVVLYALRGDLAEGFGQSTTLVFYLLILNSPATLIANAEAYILTSVLGTASWFSYLFAAIWCAMISIQWMFVGGVIQLFRDEHRIDQQESIRD